MKGDYSHYKVVPARYRARAVGTAFAAVVIAAREDNKNDPRIARFIKAYQSDEVKAFVAQKFPGAYSTSW